jgi:Domain of unknown function (DUF4166)/Saccharopine dehydrogenase NADP binding domain
VTRRIVLIGATGFFGRRLAKHLATIGSIELLLTSRDAARAEALAVSLMSSDCVCTISGRAFDSSVNAKAALAELEPFLVIDASGPFQRSNYELARAAINAGAHWIDLADASGYITGFAEALDQTARANGVTAIAGASSTPALSTAAVEDLTRQWRRIDTVDIAIFPGGGGQVGLSVIQALLTYAGRPIAIWRNGKRRKTFGWGSVMRARMPNLGVRYLSPVETADANILPERFSIASRVTFYAGLESRLEQFGLLALARLRAQGWLKTLDWLAPGLEKARYVTRVFASDKGGMTVDVAGLDGDGKQTWSRWWLLAEKGEGPNVPILPALAMTRALLSGGVAPGARSAAGEQALGDIEAEMRAAAIQTSRTVITAGSAGLFAHSCGMERYGALPLALRAFHDGDGAPVWSGRAEIDTGRSVLARVVRWVFGFPKEGRDVPVSVSVDRKGLSETWTRDFAGARFVSHLTYEGQGQVAEAFGPFKILLGVEALGSEIIMPVTGWRLGPLRLPGFLAPESQTREYADGDGRFYFDVRITVPLAGLIAHYRGWLKPGASDT